jgi:hypothetical protein
MDIEYVVIRGSRNLPNDYEIQIASSDAVMYGKQGADIILNAQRANDLANELLAAVQGIREHELEDILTHD